MYPGAVIAGHPRGSRPARAWLLALAVLALAVVVSAVTNHMGLALAFLVAVYVILQVGVILGVRRRNRRR